MNNETIQHDSAPDVTWPEGDHLERVSDTPMLPGIENAPSAGVDPLKNAVQGAHDTIDHVADRATTAVQQLGESTCEATEALHAKADQLRQTRDEWAESVRTKVRGNPLVAVAAAVTLGALIARITHRRQRKGLA